MMFILALKEETINSEKNFKLLLLWLEENVHS